LLRSFCKNDSPPATAKHGRNTDGKSEDAESGNGESIGASGAVPAPVKGSAFRRLIRRLVEAFKLGRRHDDETEDAKSKVSGSIGVFVALPAAVKGTDFLRLLARRLVEAVPGYESPQQKRLRARRIAAYAAGIIGPIVLWVGIMGTLDSSGVWFNWLWRPTTLWWIPVIVGFVLYFIGIRGLIATRRSQSRPDGDRGDTVAKHQQKALVRHADDLMKRVRYTETLTAQAEGTLGWNKHGFTFARGRSLSELPLSEADVVAEIASVTDELDQAGYRVIVAIDEMDKLQTGDKAEGFLNSVKQLFAIRSCSFLVSVSSSAWMQFVRRSVDVRNVIESSLDGIEELEPFNFIETRSLIRHRRENLTDTQILFCHVLSGGIPREALRCARQLALESHQRHGGESLAAVAPRVLRNEVELLVDGLREQAERLKRLIGFQRGVTVASRPQFGLPA
jgi:hypothetical protein